MFSYPVWIQDSMQGFLLYEESSYTHVYRFLFVLCLLLAFVCFRFLLEGQREVEVLLVNTSSCAFNVLYAGVLC
jgi:hypothetical protein